MTTDSIHRTDLPAHALLRRYLCDGHYADCYVVEVPMAVSQAGFVEAFFDRFEAFQRPPRHPKWREVDLSLPNLSPGWSYYAPTTREIRACANKAAKLPAKTNKKCNAEEKILGLCS